ncbi:MAG: hypothetical protein IJA87_04535 [Clostridia bacterium]|nr:hypothetical protein [Clostridia bacterium]
MSKKAVKNNKKFKLNPFAVVALVICALAVIYTATTAWLTGEPLNPIRFTTLEDFDYKMNVYFLQDDGTKIYVIQDSEDKGVYTSLSGAIELNYSDSAAPNYVSRLRAEIKQLGNGVAFSRVRVSHEWLYIPSGSTEETRLQGDVNLPYTINNDEFADSRMTDGYLYHKGILDEGDGYIEVINGFDVANFDASAITALSGSVELSVNVTVDAVQFNRYQQFWGMTSRPWDITT